MNLLNRLFPDKRTPEQKTQDAIRKMVEDYRPNENGLILSHTVTPWYYGDKLNTTVIDYKPELNRTFH